MKTFAQLSVAALASYATAASVDINKRETPLSVQLTATGNSEVKIAVTNNGEKTLNLLSKGTFLDEKTPVEKVSIYSAGGSMYHFTTLHAYRYRAFDFNHVLTSIQAPRSPSRA
jgi:deuterolysin